MTVQDMPVFQVFFKTEWRDENVSWIDSLGRKLFHRRQAQAAFLVCLALWATASFSASPSAIFQAARGNVLALEIRDAKGERISAHTAIVLDERQLVTSCEPLYGDRQLVVLKPDGAEVPVTRGAADPQRNLCLLESMIPLALGQKLGERLPATGERIFAISNALGFGMSITEGIVSGIRIQAGETYLQFTAPIAPGSEGGALVDETGALLGVIDYRHRDGQNVNFSAPASWIAEVGARTASQKNQLSQLEMANTLASKRDWSALARHAEGWVKAYPDDPQAHFWLGGTAAVLGQWPEAERGYREAFRLNPDLLRAGIGLADVLLRQRKATESAEVAQRLLIRRQEDADVWSLLGRVAMAQNDLKSAEQAFRKVISLNPWTISAYEGLAVVAERRGDALGQVDAWNAATSIDPDSSNINLRLASAWLAAGKPKKALQIVERVLTASPANGDAWYWKGETLLRMQRPRQAEAALRQSLAANPKAPAWVWSTLAEALWAQHRLDEAVAAKREAVKAEPESAAWRGQLGVKLKDAGYLDEALGIFQGLAVESPEDPFSHRQIGFVYAGQSLHKESIVELERALAIDPKQGKVWAALIEQYHAAERKEDALRAYRRLREIDSEFADVAYRNVIVTYEAAR